MNKKTTLLVLFFLLINMFSFSQEVKKNHPLLTDKFMFNAGVYSSNKIFKIKVDGSGPNSIIDFEEALGLNNNQSTFFFNFNWRFSKNWTLSSEYFSVKGGNKWQLKEDVNWEDVTFKEESNVKIGAGLDMYRIFVGRTVFKKLNHELGVGLGVHALNVGAYIKGDAYINEEDFNFEKKSVSVIAPLPNLGVWYFYSPSEKWGFTARLDLFGISIGDYFGSLWNVGPGVNYQVFKNIGIGLSYRYFKFTAKVNESNWNGEFNLIFQGPLFSISGNF